MKSRKILIFFFIALFAITFVISGTFYFFQNEKAKTLNQIIKTSRANSVQLIAEKVYEDLLIQNEIEANRKLNLMIDSGIIQKFKFGKEISTRDASHFDYCEQIYFDKHSRKTPWGKLCLDFTDKYKSKSNFNFSTISFAILFLICFILLLTIAAMRFIFNANTTLNTGIFEIISNNKKPATSSLWFPVLNELKKLVDLQKETEEKLFNQQVNQEKIKLATAVAHDIRSPLAALKSIAELNKKNISHYELLEKSIERINEIAENLLDKKTDSYLELRAHSVVEFVSQIIEEKKLENYGKLDIKLLVNNTENAFFDPPNFKRILSNLINNSIEASSNIPCISISVSQYQKRVEIILTDKGSGIPENVIAQLGKVQISSKENGHGIGFKHAVDMLKKWKGDLKIISSSKFGTQIKIELEAETLLVSSQIIQNKTTTILIDDDELTRTTWEMKAKKNNIELKTFKDIFSFKTELDTFSKDAIIYIDSELGEIKGETFALELNQLGFSNISIASGHPPERFAEYTFLRSVISKKAPF